MYAKGYGNLEIANNLNVKQNTISTIKKGFLINYTSKTLLI
ncbi:hypothetical protein [Chryseobacterium indoltheticum]